MCTSLGQIHKHLALWYPFSLECDHIYSSIFSSSFYGLAAVPVCTEHRAAHSPWTACKSITGSANLWNVHLSFISYMCTKIKIYKNDYGLKLCMILWDFKVLSPCRITLTPSRGRATTTFFHFGTENKKYESHQPSQTAFWIRTCILDCMMQLKMLKCRSS